MEINSINSSYLNRSAGRVQEMFGMGILKKQLSNQQVFMAELLKSLPDAQIGQNVDITV